MLNWRFAPATPNKHDKSDSGWMAYRTRFTFDPASSTGYAGDAAAVALLDDIRNNTLPPAPGVPLVPITQAGPVYPATLRNAGLTDAVLVDFMIDATGKVQWATPLSYQNAQLGWSAVTAVSQWRFQPPQLNGQNAAVHARVKLAFKPEAPPST